jgi:hypothetical protein
MTVGFGISASLANRQDMSWQPHSVPELEASAEWAFRGLFTSRDATLDALQSAPGSLWYLDETVRLWGREV